MTHALTREQVRRVDKTAIEQYGINGLVLMENAAIGTAAVVDSLSAPGTVAILCGKGNNAGDGYAIARHLEIRGWTVRILQMFPADDLTGDALVNWEISQRAGIATDVLPSDASAQRQAIIQGIGGAAVILDCMLGTGARGAPRAPLDTAIAIANDATAMRIAVDIPTGLDCDSGETPGVCFRAHHTVTFVGPKIGFNNPTAERLIGRVHVVGIGVPRKLLMPLANPQDD
jgi:NAD(P)H-hydrate epimerase